MWKIRQPTVKWDVCEEHLWVLWSGLCQIRQTKRQVMLLGSVCKSFLFKWKTPARNVNNNVLWKLPANRKARNHGGKRNKSNNRGKKACFLPKAHSEPYPLHSSSVCCYRRVNGDVRVSVQLHYHTQCNKMSASLNCSLFSRDLFYFCAFRNDK